MTKHIQSALVLYPHQLFAVELLPEVDVIYVVEEPLLFGTDAEFPIALHKQKLVLLRASMRRYVEEVLWQNDLNVEYIELQDVMFSSDVLVRAQKAGAEQVYVFDPADYMLESRLKKALDEIVEPPFELRILPSPSFLLKQTEVRDYFADKSDHEFAGFYQWQRERFNILIDKKYKPVGGKWSFDTDESKPLPKDKSVPGFNGFGDNKYVEEAKKWVEKRFAGNTGELDEFFWPTSHTEAESWLAEFIKERLENFAVYGQAIDGGATFLYHSGISAPLNIGLLTPKLIIEIVLAYHTKTPVNMASLEGFIREIIGWREYVRGLYVVNGVTMRNSNALKQSRTLSNQWWDGTSGIPPLDDVIAKVIKHAYANWVERSLIISNLMLLCDINPSEIYRWFMSQCIDAYDWASVPNSYGISQLDNLGNMINYPVIVPSSAILKVSHYEKDVWCDVWDGLYWGFIERYQDVLAKNPGTSHLVKGLKKLGADRKRIIGYRAQDFLESIS